jgi:hypothetical protein
MEWHITQHIANNVDIFGVLVSERVRLYFDEFASLLIKVERDVVRFSWLAHNTQDLALIALALSFLVRRKEEPVAVAIQ